MAERTRRLFFALWPSDALRHQIGEAVAPLIPPRTGRLIPSANLHITLAFLGSVSDQKLLAVSSAAERSSGPPFEMQFERVRTLRRGQILCLMPGSIPDALAVFVQQLRTQLLEGALEPDQKPFRPHVTLARDWRSPVDQEVSPIVWPAREFVLVESDTRPEGSRYAIVGRWRLRE